MFGKIEPHGMRNPTNYLENARKPKVLILKNIRQISIAKFTVNGGGIFPKLQLCWRFIHYG